MAEIWLHAAGRTSAPADWKNAAYAYAAVLPAA